MYPQQVICYSQEECDSSVRRACDARGNQEPAAPTGRLFLSKQSLGEANASGPKPLTITAQPTV